jgi:hypothetical protein
MKKADRIAEYALINCVTAFTRFNGNFEAAFDIPKSRDNDFFRMCYKACDDDPRFMKQKIDNGGRHKRHNQYVYVGDHAPAPPEPRKYDCIHYEACLTKHRHRKDNYNFCERCKRYERDQELEYSRNAQAVPGILKMIIDMESEPKEVY